MRVLVTGAAGFIGRWACRELLRRGHELVAVDALLGQVHGYAIHTAEYVETVIGSTQVGRRNIYVCRVGALPRAVLKGVDAVLHLAAEVGTGQGQYRVERYVGANVAETAHLLELAVGAGSVRRVVVAGSMAAYGEGDYRCPLKCAEWELRKVLSQCHLGGRRSGMFDHVCPGCGSVLEHQPVRESHACRPRSVYGLTKLHGEQLVQQVCEARGLSWASARMFNCYGPEQSLQNPYTGAAAIFTARARRGLAPTVYEDGQQLRSFVYVEDVARALADLVEQDVGGPYNVCGEEPDTVLSVAALIAGLHRSKPPVVTGQIRSGDVRHCYGTAEDLAEATGWCSTVTLIDGLERLAEWARSQPDIVLSDVAERELMERGLIRETAWTAP